jgi:NAD(P)-dependent dehydrogenase (short-subunit alcohol dehydrogenase family)
LARNGARVVVNDVGAGAAAVVDEIVAAGGEAIVSTESVATAEGREAIVATAVEAFGRIEIVVNNAGILGDKTFGKIDWDDFDAVHAVHLRGSAYVSQPAYRLMKEQGYGRSSLSLPTQARSAASDSRPTAQQRQASSACPTRSRSRAPAPAS